MRLLYFVTMETLCSFLNARLAIFLDKVLSLSVILPIFG